jgi:hypothetical protein
MHYLALHVIREFLRLKSTCLDSFTMCLVKIGLGSQNPKIIFFGGPTGATIQAAYSSWKALALPLYFHVQLPEYRASILAVRGKTSSS